LQALGQARLGRMLRSVLDARIPEPLVSVREREDEERWQIGRLLKADF
jgi:hypothetical protein